MCERVDRGLEAGFTTVWPGGVIVMAMDLCLSGSVFNFHNIRAHSHTHTLCWDGMGWAALVTRCILMEMFTHKLRCAVTAVLHGAGKNAYRVFTSTLILWQARTNQ